MPGGDPDGIRSIQEVCDAFPSGTIADEDLKPVQSEVPVLLLSGEFDPLTPAPLAELVLAGLPNGQHHVIGGLSHAVFFDNACVQQLMVDFLAEPNEQVSHECDTTVDWI